eukprot:TRINITY_DN6744_c0_g1_i1.p1 TRINITY_DN6744_c0_g1~~TRINITY_DN6744_c0_g1_i1.p1  ORF type:complete len:193 (-),score=21.65 TRINITY_DN6744_c0_g1_i1:13-591(-)
MRKLIVQMAIYLIDYFFSIRFLAAGEATAWNMMPTMTGELWSQERQINRKMPLEDRISFGLKGFPLWSNLKNIGYVTAIGSTTMWGFSQGFDHPFFKYPPDIFIDPSTRTRKTGNGTTQKMPREDFNNKLYCDHPDSKMELQFVQNFMNTTVYSGYPKFVYVHLLNQPGRVAHKPQPLLDEPLLTPLIFSSK